MCSVASGYEEKNKINKIIVGAEGAYKFFFNFPSKPEAPKKYPGG
jgi:hypothetical protein